MRGRMDGTGSMAQPPGLAARHRSTGNLDPFFRGYDCKILAGWNAVEAYFQISGKEARSLFGFATKTDNDSACVVLARMLAFFGPAMERHLGARSDIPF